MYNNLCTNIWDAKLPVAKDFDAKRENRWGLNKLKSYFAPPCEKNHFLECLFTIRGSTH